MLINILVLYLFKLIFSLDLTIVDYKQKIIVPLQHYFNNSLQYNFFRINTDKSIPQNITQYLSFDFSNKFLETSFAEMSVVTSQNTTFRLNQHVIYQTLSILTQPIKIFLTEDTLMMVIFDDQLQDKSILLSSLNLSQNQKKTLSCKEQIFDPQFFKLFVQCKNKQNDNPITILVNLQKDINLIVNGMVYVKSFNTKGYLKQCNRSKILYIYQDVIIGDHIASNQIMLYCPYSKNNLNHFTSIFFNASLDQKSSIAQVNLTKCSSDCCYAAQTIMYKFGKFYMVTNVSVLRYISSSFCESTVKYTDFISMRMGSIKQQQDIYVLTQQYLIMVYPKLTNQQKVDVTTDNMKPIGFTITKNYIIIQLLNDTIQQSILKVYKIVNYHPQLIDIVNIDYSQILFATENYLEGADYMYLYTQNKNILSTAYYKGPQLTIEAKTTFQERKSFLASVQNYDNTTLSTNQILNISIFVYNYNNSDYFIQYNQLRYNFQQSFVKIPLRDGVIGPLVEFYTIDQISLQKQFLNGIYLINMQKVIFYQQNIDSVVGIMLERLKNSSQKLMVKFAQKNIQNSTLGDDIEKDQYILLYECSLIYNISVFVIQQCFNDNIKIINQSYINIRQLKGFYYIQNLNNDTDNLNYLLYDTDYILLCNDTFCQKKQRAGDIKLLLECKTIKLMNTKQDVFLMFLRNDSKSLTLFSLGHINTTFLTQILIIDEKKLKDLNNDSIKIVDFYIDWQFQSFLIIHLSNSKVFVIQKQQDKTKTICHATSLIQIGNITECKQFVKTFYVGEGVSKIIILCNNFSQYHLVEFTINNLFDLQKTRQYPLYDYKVNNNSALHFCDNQFLYIAVTGSQPYYLVYNTHAITPNSLMYKIPTDQYYHLIGNIRNIVKSKGYGLVDKWAYIISNSYYEGNLQVKNSSRNVVRDTASFAVRNNKDQLSLVQFELFIDFSKSNINYQIQNPKTILPRQASSQLQINQPFNFNNLNGPVFQVDLSSSCKDWPQITQQKIFTKQACIAKNQTIGSVLSQDFGTFLGEASLDFINVVITKKVVMCIINKTIIKYSQHQPEADNCTISDFSSLTQKQVIFVCVYINSSSNFQIIKVSDECEMTFKPLKALKSKYFNLKTYYPNIIIQAPILLGQIKNYSKCIFDERIQQISNCKIMTYGLQNTFLSSDYDIFKDHGLILQKGIGIFSLRDSYSDQQINCTDWITEQKLEEFGIIPPYKYVKLNSISDKGEMIIEIADQKLALQLIYNSNKQIKLFKTYEQYVGCTNINFKSIDIDIYKIKICQFLKSSAQILDETIPIQQHSVRLAQFYLKQKQHNYPVSMFNLADPKTSLLFQSFNQILQITSNTSMCYYNLRPNISWILTFHIDKYDVTCENSFNLKNNHTSKSIPISYTIEELPPITLRQKILRVLVHVPFILLLIAYPIIKFCSKRQRKSLPNPLSKKVSYNKNFYSNDFEEKLKGLNQSLIESKI